MKCPSAEAHFHLEQPKNNFKIIFSGVIQCLSVNYSVDLKKVSSPQTPCGLEVYSWIMEPTKEQIAIKELSMAVYEQSKELARKDRKIEELQARLNAIHDLVIKTISPREDPITGNNIWIENRKAMQHTSSSGIA